MFFAAVDVVYWLLSQRPGRHDGAGPPVGLAFMVGYYLLFTARRIDARPEDHEDAEISDGAGELGFFSPHSWWPLSSAWRRRSRSSASSSAGGCSSSACFVIIMSMIGFVFEYYRGHFSH